MQNHPAHCYALEIGDSGKMESCEEVRLLLTQMCSAQCCPVKL